jgi:thiol-disulfide isomerase/thioredoxin
MPRHACALALLLAGLLPVPAMSAPPAAGMDVLQKVATTYKGLKRYQFQGEILVVASTNAGPAQSQTVPFFVAVDGQGRIRDEVKGGPAPGLIISDGKETVIYNTLLGQYVRHAGNADVALAGASQRGVGSMVVSRFTTVASGVVSVKPLPGEPLTVDGVKHDCRVLEVTYQRSGNDAQVVEGARRYWIDPRTHLVLRMRTQLKADAPQYGGKVEQTETTVFRSAKLDPVFADSIWVFKPPAMARAVAQFDPRADPAPAFTGKPAIDFSLTDLQGRTHSLSSMRGKTVLLDFWATWCGPCRMTMPQVAKIHAEYKDRGVEVMSINVGEPAAKAADYIAKNGYAFTTLLDKDREVSTSYRVNGIPTLIVIDASGTISDYLVGARDDKALRAALKKAGVN